MYTISKTTGLDEDHHGHETEYVIDFAFNNQKAKVTIELDSESPNRCRIVSNTDGYHWLQFFLSQVPGTDRMIEFNSVDQIAICQRIFALSGIYYDQEDKESAFLDYGKPIDQDFARIVADIIEPRFANRERFFE